MKLNYGATINKIIDKVNSTPGYSINIEKLSAKKWKAKELKEFCDFVNIEAVYS